MSDTRIYVACLADYNNGNLHGEWIDCDGLSADDIQNEVNEMLRASKFPNITVDCPDCNGTGEAEHENALGEMGACPYCFGKGKVPSAEEWAIHDHEGFFDLIGESTSFEYVAKAAEMIAEHGEAYAKYAAYAGGDDLPDADDFTDHYNGDWEDLEAYADDYIESCGLLESMPENLRCYFDTERFARDMELGGDVHTERLSNGMLAVFSN